MKSRFVIKDDATREHAIEAIRLLGKDIEWEVTVGRHKKRRTLDQNALYWMLVNAVADHTGHTNDEIHEFWKAQFLTPTVIDLGGRKAICRSTTQLDTKAMSDYFEKCRAWAATELGVTISMLHEAA